MAATDTSCSLRSGSRREGLHKDHMKSMHSLRKKGNKTRGHDVVEISDGNGCDDTCNINCRLQCMFRFTNQTSKSRAVVLSFNFVNGLAFGLLVHNHNCQIPDNVSEHRFQDARHHDPCINRDGYGERQRKKKRKKKRQPGLQERNRRKERAKQAGACHTRCTRSRTSRGPSPRPGNAKKKAGTLLIG